VQLVGQVCFASRFRGLFSRRTKIHRGQFSRRHVIGRRIVPCRLLLDFDETYAWPALWAGRMMICCRVYKTARRSEELLFAHRGFDASLLLTSAAAIGLSPKFTLSAFAVWEAKVLQRKSICLTAIDNRTADRSIRNPSHDVSGFGACSPCTVSGLRKL